jgi:putative spermidine/putrescine transport system substrate-binding protein
MTGRLLGAKVSRRDLLRGSTIIAGATLAGGGTMASAPARAWGASKPSQIVVRDSGGAYQDAKTKAIYTPFTQATGIRVVPINLTTAQVLASVQQHHVQVDVTDDSTAPLLRLANLGALARLDYGGRIGRSFNLSDVPKNLVQPYFIGNIYWASVLAYRTDVFPEGKGPKTWEDFWDVERFPGPRSMQDDTADVPELEFAEIADGIPAQTSRLYPIALDRAFQRMDKIRPHIVKFWNAGALPQEMLDRKDVVMTTIWNGRAQTLIDSGRPVAISWAGARRQINNWAVPKGAPHLEAAFQFIDFAMQPKIQADLARHIAYAPTNKAARALLPVSLAAALGQTPEEYEAGFDIDTPWWVANMDGVIKRWNAWAQR